MVCHWGKCSRPDAGNVGCLGVETQMPGVAEAGSVPVLCCWGRGGALTSLMRVRVCCQEQSFCRGHLGRSQRLEVIMILPIQRLSRGEPSALNLGWRLGADVLEPLGAGRNGAVPAASW